MSRTIPVGLAVLVAAAGCWRLQKPPPPPPPPATATATAAPDQPEEDLAEPDIRPVEEKEPDPARLDPVPEVIVPGPVESAPTSIPPPPAAGPGLPGAVGGDPAAGGFARGPGVTPGFAGGSGTTRDKLLAGSGPGVSEAAVARGLIWLAKQQKADGSWVYDGNSRAQTAASTGMALSAFLGAGQTHRSAEGNKYKASVEAGLKYLLALQRQDGGFSNNMYAHAIATMAVCEALAASGDRGLLQRPAQRAVNFIQSAQGTNGSWGYGPNSNGDTSITGWQVQALHAARSCKELVVNKTAAERAMKFLDTVASGPGRSQYGYNSPGATPTLTAVGLLCRHLEGGWGPDHPGMDAGVAYLLKTKPPVAGRMDLYYYHYATRLLHALGGPRWQKDWSPKMRDVLVKSQVPEGRRDAGSWDPEGDAIIGGQCGRVGTTALAVRVLEEPSRRLPLKRDAAKEPDPGK